MDRLTSEELQRSVSAQAQFRLTFGVLVASAIVAAYFLMPHEGKPSPLVVIAMFGFYALYAGAARYLAARPRGLTLRDLVMVTAVMDPLFLSAWLFAAGESGFLVAGMYLFTILGFGFRVGAMPMHLCQAVSLAGFTVVVAVSPTWQDDPLFAVSHMIMLGMVPIYASFLIKRIQAAKALAEHESQAKSRLLAKVSHELRTPLTGITAAAQLLQVESREEDTVRRAVSIQQLADTLETEIKQLLELSTIETRRGRGTRERSFSLRDVATRAHQGLESIAAGKGLSVHLEFDDHLGQRVLGLPDEIVAVLTNLSGNAVKFTPRGGAVTLQFRLVDESDEGCRVHFGVMDTGIGIPAEHLDRIFEPFYQIEEGRTQAMGGTGLGTTIARELVRGMGGELHVTSAVGEGSVFWFVLDLAVDRALAPAAATHADRDGLAVPSKRVLVADDNTTNLELMNQMLQKGGHAVTAVAGGREALARLATEEFDIIFLDYNMDEVDGAMVLQTYAFSRIETAPVFFVTADSTERTAAMLRDIGAAGVICKPVTFEKMGHAFATAFPGEGLVDAGAPPPGRRGAVELSAVPVAYVDMAMIDTLREIRDTPEFLGKMIGDGMKDIEILHLEMLQALGALDLAAVHRAAHTLKGVALNVGAVRLAAIADKLMAMTYDGLASTAERWRADVTSTTRHSLHALDALRRDIVPPQAVND